MTLYKLWAFALASFVTGAAGCMLAATRGGQLNAVQFEPEQSILLLAVVLMGGIYSLWGAVLAGLFLRLLPELLKDWLSDAGLPEASGYLLFILFGVGVIQVVLTAPRGLVDQVPRDLKRLGRGLYRVAGRVAGAKGPAA